MAKVISILFIIMIILIFKLFIISFRFICHTLLNYPSIPGRERQQLATDSCLIKIVLHNNTPAQIDESLHCDSLQHHLSKLEQCQQKLLQERALRQEAERKLQLTRNQLVHSAKMASIGKTFATLAHELNQPLSALSAYIFSTQRALEHEDMETAISLLHKSSQMIERTALIIQRLRHFSRKDDDTLPIRAVNVVECLQEAWSLLEIIHKNKQPILEAPLFPLYVMADEILLQQVFVNIFSNALEAVTKGKTYIKIFAEITDDNILLFISDNGPGWSSNASTELLQPFSSSKTDHLGMGLSISNTIMDKFSGELLLASTLQHNAMVILQFRKAPHVE